MEAGGSSRICQQCYSHPCQRRIALPFRTSPVFIFQCISKYNSYFCLACKRMHLMLLRILEKPLCWFQMPSLSAWWWLHCFTSSASAILAWNATSRWIKSMPYGVCPESRPRLAFHLAL